MFDLKITGGTVVDGTGADRFTADVAIKDGKIVEVHRRGTDDPALAGDAAETIDATGKIVAPGFVDIHTHYDGQVSWDAVLEPSSNHGVTTVVAGNCGVGFAPVRPGQEEWLISLMEGVEDIPGTALTEGITWGWETFGEYLDVIGKRELAVDMGTQIAHGAIRAYAIATPTRSPALPDVPTMREAGVADYEVASWNALAAPAKTPTAVIERLNAAANEALKNPAVQERLLALGVRAQGGTPQQLQTLLASEVRHWG